VSTDVKTLLLQYASALREPGSDMAPEAIARERGWLDDKGEATKAGVEAAKAFGEQQKTRSAFRLG